MFILTLNIVQDQLPWIDPLHWPPEVPRPVPKAYRLPCPFYHNTLEPWKNPLHSLKMSPDEAKLTVPRLTLTLVLGSVVGASTPPGVSITRRLDGHPGFGS